MKEKKCSGNPEWVHNNGLSRMGSKSHMTAKGPIGLADTPPRSALE